jgi:hypothetical protein
MAMGQLTMDNLKEISWMDLVITSMIMATDIRVTGKIIHSMGKECILGQMMIYILENTVKVVGMGMECLQYFKE